MKRLYLVILLALLATATDVAKPKLAKCAVCSEGACFYSSMCGASGNHCICLKHGRDSTGQCFSVGR